MSFGNEEPDWINTIPTMNFSDPTVQHNRVLVVEGEKFYVNADILSIHSEFFNSLFNGEFKEKNENEIEIKDVTAEAFRNFLLTMYPARFHVNEENYKNLLDLSTRFLAPGTLDKCRWFILEKFENLDKFDLLEIAVKHNLKDIKEKLSTYFGVNQRRVGSKVSCCGVTGTLGPCRTCQSSLNYEVPSGNILNEHSFLTIHKDPFIAMSSEAKIFILESVINNI